MESLKIFITLSICLSILVITAPNAVYSVLYLILVFCVNTALLLNLGAEFLALIFLIVYVGAIAVLFLFVVMMLNIKSHTTKTKRWGPMSLLFLGAMLFGGLNFYMDNVENFTLNFKIEHFSLNIDTLFNISLIGFLIYTYFYNYFIIAGIILLQAMIGAIILTMLKHKKIMRQNIFSQASRKPGNAVFLTEIQK